VVGVTFTGPKLVIAIRCGNNMMGWATGLGDASKRYWINGSQWMSTFSILNDCYGATRMTALGTTALFECPLRTIVVIRTQNNVEAIVTV